MNSIDIKILALLQDRGKLSYAEIGEHVKLSVTAVKERIKRLLNKGILTKNVFLVNPHALGLEICAFVQVLMPEPSEETNFVSQMLQIPEVQECHSITGDYSYLLKIRVPNTRRLEELMSEKITSIKGVIKTNSIITLTTFKESTQLPLPHEI